MYVCTGKFFQFILVWVMFYVRCDHFYIRHVCICVYVHNIVDLVAHILLGGTPFVDGRITDRGSLCTFFKGSISQDILRPVFQVIDHTAGLTLIPTGESTRGPHN